MRLLALLCGMLPTLCFAGWSVLPTSDARGAAGFEVYLDGQLKFKQDPLYGPDWYSEFFYADFISDDGYIAGHYQPYEDIGFWHLYSDPGAFTIDRQGQMRSWGVGLPVWMNDKEWACFDSYTPFLANAASGNFRESECANLDPSSIPEPSTGALAMILGILGICWGRRNDPRRLNIRSR